MMTWSDTNHNARALSLELAYGSQDGADPAGCQLLLTLANFAQHRIFQLSFLLFCQFCVWHNWRLGGRKWVAEKVLAPPICVSIATAFPLAGDAAAVATATNNFDIAEQNCEEQAPSWDATTIAPSGMRKDIVKSTWLRDINMHAPTSRNNSGESSELRCGTWVRVQHYLLPYGKLWLSHNTEKTKGLTS